MKVPAALSTAVLVASAAAFDKNQPWGKRDYNCVNVFQGIPDNATVAPETEITIKFNRDSKNCAEYLSKFEGSDYSINLYNNPVRNLDVIKFDKQILIQKDIPEKTGTATITIPSKEELGTVADDSVWYLRISTSLQNAPQWPSIFYAAGPFSIR
ncbi:hypothetical protein BDV28DRAFT_8303 [Aspergillus coremiiformis]|uniref:Uncharacterized protein n=1 Tax=Aspergillus coremiiformis TaxID=138285 RepID=A0A5N6Z2Y9_9EURO|nr:hypothetical protein BDV28DRAFT_8303 [Aspergillus coremiiformis]